jgi:hypothetical protein
MSSMPNTVYDIIDMAIFKDFTAMIGVNGCLSI